MKTVTRGLFVVAITILTSGCVKAISSPMRQLAAAPETRAPADRARLLVVRPSRAAGKFITHHVVDGDRVFLGDAFNDSAFSVDLPPGDHNLCVANAMSGGPAVKARLAAGKTYVVRVDIAMGYPYLTPLKPGSSDLRELLGDLQGIRGTELIANNADAPNAEDLQGLFSRCSTAAADASSEDKARLVLHEADAI